MNEINNNQTFLIKEYEKLKEEQHLRIQFRDQMIFITLGAIGAVFSFVLEKPEYWIVLLVLPFMTFLLGWTYAMNDNKVSEIGDYIREQLIPQLTTTSTTWESYHKSTAFRKLKKTTQLLVDLLIFGVAPFMSIILFFVKSKDYSWYYISAGIVEFALIIYIVILFVFISPLRKK